MGSADAFRPIVRSFRRTDEGPSRKLRPGLPSAGNPPDSSQAKRRPSPLMESHHIHPELLRHKVRVLVVGCGGNGSAIAAGLPYLHQALLARGHPEGIHVTLLDPDVISPTNCVRQPFSRSEVGLSKAVVVANRLNLFWGLDWQGIP